MKKTVAVILALIMAFSSISCATTQQTSVSDIPQVDINETQPLVVGVTNLTENLNPIFATDSGSKSLAKIMNTALVSVNSDGTLSFGEGKNALAKDVLITFTTADGVESEKYVDGAQVTYTFVLKNDMKFSNGKSISANDVLFTLYTLLDPLYDGAYNLKSLAVKGLERYSLQMTPEIKDEYLKLAETFLENGKDFEYDETEKPLADAFFDEILSLAGEEYCRACVNYVCQNFLTDEYVARYLSEELTANEVSQNETLKIAYAMIVWEVGAFDENGKFAFSQKTVDIKNGEQLTLGDFWTEIHLKQKEIKLIDGEAVGDSTLSNIATELFVEKYGPLAMEEKIDSIEGVVLGETLIDNESFETVSITLENYSPSFVYEFSIPILSREYYVSGYTYPKNAKVQNGVAHSEESFISHIKSIIHPEVVSGAYKSSVGPTGAFFEDGVYYLLKNEYFSTVSGENAKINNLWFALKTTDTLDDVTCGAYSLTQVTLDNESAKNLSENASLGFFKVPANAYGYILINPHYYPDINERIALSMLFDTSLALKYYPENTASAINRSFSMASYVYQTEKTLYPYTESDYTIREYFTKAGYTFEDGKMLNSTGEVAKFVFTLPTAVDSHPSGAVFKEAVARLSALGANAEIVVNETLTQDIYSAQGVAIYALARNLSADADMRNIFDHSSLSDTVKANGIAWLWENGASEDIGTVEINETQYTQEKALEHLSDLLGTAATLTDYSARREYYIDALTTISKLCVEIPVYQKNAVLVYKSDVLDVSDTTGEFSALHTPLDELYKLKFK